MSEGTGTASDIGLLGDLQHRVYDMLGRVLDGASTVALLDLPYHRNAGDAAIWAGERAALDALGVRVAYVADAGRFDPDRLREAVPEGPVLLTGGGNVGDLWPWPQALRERVLGELRDRPVVQLPQSMHFRHDHEERRFAELVQKHGNFTFVARDPTSYARAERLGARELILAPDMAFALGALRRHGAPTQAVLALARDDIEGASGLRDVQVPGVHVADWSLGRMGFFRWQVTRSVPRLARAAKTSPRAWRLTAGLTTDAMESMCRQVLDGGIGLLSTAEVVVTDRLHAHILCVLLGIPHIVLDNSYGKIRSLHDQWTFGSRTTWWSEDAAEAIGQARELIRR